MAREEAARLRVDWLVALAAALAHGLVAVGSLTLTRHNGLAVVWPANAIVLVALHARPGARLPIALLVLLTSTVANAIGGNAVPLAAGFALANVVEAWVAVALLARLGADRLSFGRSDLPRFVLAVMVGAGASAVLSTALAGLAGEAGGWPFFQSWLLSCLLGQLIVAPMLLTGLDWLRTRRRQRPPLRALLDYAWVLGAVSAIAVIVFAQNAYPLLFLVNSAIAWATFRLRRLGAIAGTIIVAVVATYAMITESGPVALVHGSPEHKMLLLQLFLATVFVSALPIAAALAERDAAVDRARANAQAYADVVHSVADVIFTADAEARWTFLNPAWTRLTGGDAGAAIGQSVFAQIEPEDLPGLLEKLREMIAGERAELRHHLRYRHASGHVRWAAVAMRPRFDEEGAYIGVTGVLTDVSDRIRLQQVTEAARADAERRANTDALTGIASRAALIADLEAAIADAHVHGAALSVAMIDVDRFKSVNDRFGHAVGDIVLQRVAKLSEETVRTSDRVGRLGGEEFVIVMRGAGTEVAWRAAERLRERIERERIAPLAPGAVTVSVGIAELAPGGAASDLLATADRALYRAKAAGRNRLVA